MKKGHKKAECRKMKLDIAAISGLRLSTRNLRLLRRLSRMKRNTYARGGNKKLWKWMTHWRCIEQTFQKVLTHVVPEILSDSQLKHRLRSAQHLTRCCRVVEYSNQLKRKGKPEERASQLVRIQRRRPRMSLSMQVSETGAVSASEQEPRTIHITDNFTRNPNSLSSWPTTA